MLRQQPDLLVQLSVESIFWCLILINTALWKLPPILANAAPPEKLTLSIDDNNPYIGTISTFINHLYKPRKLFLLSNVFTIALESITEV